MEKIISIKLSDGSYIRVRDAKGLEEQTLYWWDGQAYRPLTKAEKEHFLKPKTRICKGCGKEFVPNGRQQYCSKECKKPRKKPPIKKICDICGQPFIPKYTWQKYCSEECGIEGNRRTTRKNQQRYKETPSSKKTREYTNSVSKYDKPYIEKKTTSYDWLDKINENIRANDGLYKG